MQNNLKVGDTIQCYNTEDCIRTMQELSKEGIMTEFLYEKDGETGLWLEIEKMMENGRKES